MGAAGLRPDSGPIRGKGRVKKKRKKMEKKKARRKRKKKKRGEDTGMGENPHSLITALAFRSCVNEERNEPNESLGAPEESDLQREIIPKQLSAASNAVRPGFHVTWATGDRGETDRGCGGMGGDMGWGGGGAGREKGAGTERGRGGRKGVAGWEWRAEFVNELAESMERGVFPLDL